jgi:hypothetical protein
MRVEVRTPACGGAVSLSTLLHRLSGACTRPCQMLAELLTSHCSAQTAPLEDDATSYVSEDFYRILILFAQSSRSEGSVWGPAEE